MLSVGVYRHLSQCSDTSGTFTILAIDHRGNLVADLQKHYARPITYADVAAFKRSIIRHLAGAATAVLTDPDYGLSGLGSGDIPGRVGLLAPLEVTDYEPHPSQRRTNFIPGWDVRKLKRAGFSGAKLLLYYHPGAANAQSQTEIVDRVVEQCREHQVPLYLEPLSYSLDPSRALLSAERRQAVVETARHFSRRGVDVLKLEFPVDVHQEPDQRVWRSALEELNAACAVPWTLLSAGVPFDVFMKQVELACTAGASGVVAGRAVWAEAVGMDGDSREHFLAHTARERLARLADVCCALGTPWTQRHVPPHLGEGWYRDEPIKEAARP